MQTIDSPRISFENACVIFKNERSGEIGYRFAGDLLPKGAIPTAVLGADGTVVQITEDPLPGGDYLWELQTSLEALCVPRSSTVAELDFGKRLDVVLALDVSESMREEDLRPFLAQFQGRPNYRIVLFNTEVRAYDGVLDMGGGSSFRTLQEYVEQFEVHPSIVLVVTDGLGPRIRPQQPSCWVWAIVPGQAGGNNWPACANPSMHTFRIRSGQQH